jgi:hypothetical protein
MGQTPLDVTDPEPPPPPSNSEEAAPEAADDRRWRLIRRLTLLATIVPIYAAAFRNGATGWYPTLDAATVVSRARDVFSAHPPLVGMWASVSTDLGRATYFPGAIQLYLLAVPVRVLGNAWGTLMTMATINAVCVAAAGWLATRRLGPRVAIVAYLALAMLVWTMGSEVLIDAAPMQMITIPFALFLFAVWSVADGDLVALPVLAVVANFLVLDHLVFTFMIPVIGVCAIVGLAHSLCRHRTDPDTWPTHRTKALRMAGLAVAATVVLWIPTLVQQVRNSPGNLTNLWNARSITSHHNTASQAADAVVSILAKPPFWLGNSFRQPSFGAKGIGTAEVVLGILAAIGVAVLAMIAYRRRDQTSLTALIIAVVTALANSYNITRAPSPFGFRVQYLHSLWVMAMFVWLTAAITLIRNVPALSTRDGLQRIGHLGVAATVIVAAFALPHRGAARDTNGTADWSTALIRKVRRPAVDALRGKGQVLLFATGRFATFSIWSSLVLALETDGVDVCVLPEFVPQYGPKLACKSGGPDLVVAVESAVFPPNPSEKVLAEANILTPVEQANFARLAPRVAAWLSTQKKLEVTPSVHATIAQTIGEANAVVVEDRVLDTGGLDPSVLALSQQFADFVASRSVEGPDGKVIPAVVTRSFPAADLVRWAKLANLADNQRTIRIAIQTYPAGSQPSGAPG